MNGVINFKEKFDKFSETWTPKILGQFDNYYLQQLVLRKSSNYTSQINFTPFLAKVNIKNLSRIALGYLL